MSTPVVEEIVILEAQLGDTVSCRMCGLEAVWEFAMRCCGDYLFTCERHHDGLVAHLEGLVGHPSACGKCFHKFGAPSSITEFVRVVRV